MHYKLFTYFKKIYNLNYLWNPKNKINQLLKVQGFVLK